jgi:ABC-type lipoprotein release transport system permease subunit
MYSLLLWVTTTPTSSCGFSQDLPLPFIKTLIRGLRYFVVAVVVVVGGGVMFGVVVVVVVVVAAAAAAAEIEETTRTTKGWDI